MRPVYCLAAIEVYVPLACKMGLHLPDLEPGVMLLSAKTTSFVLKSKRKRGVHCHAITFNRIQIPLQPAKIATVHRHQGASLEQAVEILGKPPTGHIDPNIYYTALTRVHSSEGLALLEPLTLDMLNTAADKDNLADDRHLQSLAQQTVDRFARDEVVTYSDATSSARTNRRLQDLLGDIEHAQTNTAGSAPRPS